MRILKYMIWALSFIWLFSFLPKLAFILGVTSSGSLYLICLAVWFLALFCSRNTAEKTRKKRIKIVKKDTAPPPETGRGPTIVIDNRYLQPEKKLFEDLIKQRAARYHTNYETATTPALSLKKGLFTILLGAVTFVNAFLFLAAVQAAACILAEAIALILYFFLIRRCTIVTFLYNHIKRNPDADIDSLIANTSITAQSIPVWIAPLAVILIAAAIAWWCVSLEFGFTAPLPQVH